MTKFSPLLKKVLLLGGGLVLLVGTFFAGKKLYNFLNSSTIRNIELSQGLRFNNDTFIKDLVSKNGNLNRKFFDYDTKQIAEGLAANNANEHFFIAKVWPDSIKILVKEYQPYALWTNGKQSGYISEDGHIFYSPEQLEANAAIASFLREHPQAKSKNKASDNIANLNNTGLNVKKNPLLMPQLTTFDKESGLEIPYFPLTQPQADGKTEKGKLKLCLINTKANEISLLRLKERLETLDARRLEIKEQIHNAREQNQNLEVDYYTLHSSKEENYGRELVKLDFCEIDAYTANLTPGLSANLLNSNVNNRGTSTSASSFEPPQLELTNYGDRPIIIANRFYVPKALEYWQRIKPALDNSALSVKEIRLNSFDSWRILLSNGLVLNLDSTDIERTLKRFLIAARSIVIPEGYYISYIDLRYNNGMAVRYVTQEEVKKDPSLIIKTLIPSKGGTDLANADAYNIRVFPAYSDDNN